jgi:hypothetical protein
VTDLLQQALEADRIILSTAGRHAKEEWLEILDRKRRDINNAGHSVWVINANHARPDAVQAFCRSFGARYILFITRAANLKLDSSTVADIGTSTADGARTFSANQKSWDDLHPKLTQVTGRINRATTGIWLDALEATPLRPLDLKSFTRHHDGLVLEAFNQPNPAFLVRRQEALQAGPYRTLAVGRLAEPFAVWLRK